MSNSIQLQLRRGTRAEIQAMTPAQGELVVATDTNQVFLGDGATVGGLLITGGNAPYAVGDWTPGVAGATTAGVLTYTGQYGSYEQIGRLCIARFYVVVSAIDTAPAGNLLLTGLPFPAASTANVYGSAEVSGYDGITLPAGTAMMSMLITPGTATANIQASPGPANVNAATMTAGFFISGTLTYRTA